MGVDSQFFIPITISVKEPDQCVGNSHLEIVSLFSSLLRALLRKHALAKDQVFLSKNQMRSHRPNYANWVVNCKYVWY